MVDWEVFSPVFRRMTNIKKSIIDAKVLHVETFYEQMCRGLD